MFYSSYSNTMKELNNFIPSGLMLSTHNLITKAIFNGFEPQIWILIQHKKIRPTTNSTTTTTTIKPQVVGVSKSCLMAILYAKSIKWVDIVSYIWLANNKNKKYTRIQYSNFGLKTIILQKNVYVYKILPKSQCSNAQILWKINKMRGIYYYKFGYKTTKMKKKWIYYYIFVGNLHNYKKWSFLKKTCQNQIAFMAIFCEKSKKKWWIY